MRIFGLVLVFVLNRSKILGLIGKFLTPAILLLLFTLIVTTIFSYDFTFNIATSTGNFSHGILEGYQTFDAIGAVVVGAVIIISVNQRFTTFNFSQKQDLITKGGIIAGLGLFLVYGGLILTGALLQKEFGTDINRTALLHGITKHTLGNIATLFLSVLVSLACFTTAVGIITGAADFVKFLCKQSQCSLCAHSIIRCVIGVLIGQFNVGFIIAIAVPALLFIYPITIILIVLNVVPEKYTPPKVFRWVVAVTILFSIPDFLSSLNLLDSEASFTKYIPLQAYQMGWVLPALLTFFLVAFGFRAKSE